MLFSFLLFSGACASRRAVAPQANGKDSLTLQSKMTVSEDGKVSAPKKASNDANSLPEANSGNGKCVYGCTDPPDQNKKKEERTASLSIPAAKTQSIYPGGPSGTGIEVSQDYILGPEDVIDISVWKNENLSRVVSIRPDGKISLPLIGDVEAAGLTTSQLRDSIKEKLKEYKETPEVSIIVKEINSLVVYITGEINRPGKLMLRSNTTILQAIILAGGFTQYASPNKILLLRRVGGIDTRKQIHYKNIVSGKSPEEDILLQRGDTIIVP